MRRELGRIEGVRTKFTATIARLGTKSNFKGGASETVLFTDVRNEVGELMTAHVWFTIGKQLATVVHHVGKRVAFEARVKGYTKGYKGRGLELLKPRKEDFKLSNPTNVVLVNKDL